ncbi:MAG: glycosyltransferase [Deltaproteobacteria bacterium]|nr:glycosyltransferase [Deltaproteobacteria bacterium]
MYAEVILAALAVVLLAEAIWSHYSLSKAVRRPKRTAPLEHYPPVTVIRPIRGLDAGVEQNIEHALDHGYPGSVQTLFVFDDASEPALPLVRSAIAQRQRDTPEVDAEIVFCGAPPAGRTGKLNAMIVGLRRARGEVIVFADSDIRPSKNALTDLVTTLLTDDKTGAAFAPVVVTSEPLTLGDAGYAIMLNGLYGPVAEQTSQSLGGTLPFIMGQFMAWRRETLRAIDGLESAEGQLVDDMYLGARVHAVGLKNRLAPTAVPIVQYGLSFAEFIKVYLRWITFSRSGLPGREFKLASWVRGAVFWLGLVGGMIAALAGLWIQSMAGLLAAAAIAVSINLLHQRVGGGRLRGHLHLASFLVLLSAPLIILAALTKRKLSWRGRTYTLGSDARLAEGQALQPSHRRGGLQH